ncbi:MAG: hypothetical protein ACI9NT_000973 [Bacteroidia bacterium]|jgi:hypothetical protein
MGLGYLYRAGQNIGYWELAKATCKELSEELGTEPNAEQRAIKKHRPDWTSASLIAGPQERADLLF